MPFQDTAVKYHPAMNTVLLQQLTQGSFVCVCVFERQLTSFIPRLVSSFRCHRVRRGIMCDITEQPFASRCAALVWTRAL